MHYDYMYANLYYTILLYTYLITCTFMCGSLATVLNVILEDEMAGITIITVVLSLKTNTMLLIINISMANYKNLQM